MLIQSYQMVRVIYYILYILYIIYYKSDDSKDPPSLFWGRGQSRSWGQNCGEVLMNGKTYYHTKFQSPSFNNDWVMIILNFWPPRLRSTWKLRSKSRSDIKRELLDRLLYKVSQSFLQKWLGFLFYFSTSEVEVKMEAEIKIKVRF